MEDIVKYTEILIIPEVVLRLMRIAIEGPELSAVNFNEVLDIFKQKNRRICSELQLKIQISVGEGEGGGEFQPPPPPPPPCMEP